MSGWGLGYFRISSEGHVTVHPDTNRKRGLDLYQLAMDLNAQGVGLPLLLRFSDILRSRIHALASEFQNAIKEFGYEGTYTTVYPVKVNQQRHVVQEIVEFGAPHGVGLECGSKPELQAILGLNESTNHLIVCNGYKDEEFMRLALMGQKLGHTRDDRARAADRARGPAQGGRRDGRAADGGRPGQARHRGLRPVGQERWRALQVRARRRGVDAPARPA